MFLSADIDETGQPSQYPSSSSDYAYVPSSPFEVFLVVLLSLPSIAFIVSTSGRKIPMPAELGGGGGDIGLYTITAHFCLGEAGRVMTVW